MAARKYTIGRAASDIRGNLKKGRKEDADRQFDYAVQHFELKTKEELTSFAELCGFQIAVQVKKLSKDQ